MSGQEDYTPSGALDPVAAQIAAFFAVDPGWQAITERSPAETRAAVRAATPVSNLPEIARVENYTIAVEGGEIGVRYYQNCTTPDAILLWAHGGGFVLGSIDEIESFARTLTASSNLGFASIDYRLAPEYQFPIPVGDVRFAALWAFENVVALAGRTVPIILGGDSAGANLATVVTRKLHEAGCYTFAANILAYPSTEGPDAESLRGFEAPFLGIQEVNFFMNLYAPDKRLHRHPDFAPLYADDLHLLPPTLIITAEHDIITAQAEAYGRNLTVAGVDVSVKRHDGMIHGFLTMEAFFPGAAGEAMRQIREFIGRVVR